jgi:hypothetical protein
MELLLPQYINDFVVNLGILEYHLRNRNQRELKILAAVPLDGLDGTRSNRVRSPPGRDEVAIDTTHRPSLPVAVGHGRSQLARRRDTTIGRAPRQRESSVRLRTRGPASTCSSHRRRTALESLVRPVY